MYWVSGPDLDPRDRKANDHQGTGPSIPLPITADSLHLVETVEMQRLSTELQEQAQELGTDRRGT